jgi:cyclophilin family peptidyl-prolyl cis-trans isomerase
MAMQLTRFVLLTLALLVLAAACWLTGCGGSKADVSAAAASSTPGVSSADNAPAASTTGSAASITPTSATKTPQTPANPLVVLHTSAGDIQLRLLADKAPRTVDNFLTNYAERGFYNGTIFHHVEAGAMLIGGGYGADLQPKATRAPIFNESRSGLSNRRGTVAMVRDPAAPHSATAPFFINLADNPAFDFQAGESEDVEGYCVFAEVISGMDVVDRIASQPTAAEGDFPNVPSPRVTIVSVERLAR